MTGQTVLMTGQTALMEQLTALMPFSAVFEDHNIFDPFGTMWVFKLHEAKEDAAGARAMALRNSKRITFLAEEVNTASNIWTC